MKNKFGQRAGQKIKLTSVEELLGVSNEETALDLEIEKIQPFKNHPFKVLDDDKMQDLVESIRANGILSPVLVRPVGNDTYEMVSGHRRMHAAALLEMEKIPAIIREMTDDEAIVKMVDANIQREELLPSEKAFAYKMKMEAVKRGAGRPANNNLSQLGTNYRADQELAEQVNESRNQIRRYIRLTELIPELLEYVDQKRIKFTIGVELSYFDKEIQKWLYEYMKENGILQLKQVSYLRSELQSGAVSQGKMISILNESQPGKAPSSKITLSEKKLREYFPPHYTTSQIRGIIEELLTDWRRTQEATAVELSRNMEEV